MSFEAAIHAQAIEIGKLSLEMTAEAGSGHPSSALSIGHLVTVLMFHTMRWSPDFPEYPTSDRLVLSEGTPCLRCMPRPRSWGWWWGRMPPAAGS
ncbi:MAG: hypothetical protein IPJ41_01135 [Phycisphaerales bacterium]|nr:hypothetical protein [Phycisphaerales bacterium]